MPPLTVSYLTVKLIIPLAGPDLQMGGGGEVSRKIFSALWTSVCSKIRGTPLDPPLNPAFRRIHNNIK